MSDTVEKILAALVAIVTLLGAVGGFIYFLLKSKLRPDWKKDDEKLFQSVKDSIPDMVKLEVAELQRGFDALKTEFSTYKEAEADKRKTRNDFYKREHEALERSLTEQLTQQSQELARLRENILTKHLDLTEQKSSLRELRRNLSQIEERIKELKRGDEA